MKSLPVKGSYGYIAQKKKAEVCKTILLFFIPLALFFAGLIAAKSRVNLLTIVAVLGMLPASKSAVLMIMYLKGHGISEADYCQYESLMKGLTNSYDNIFTTYEKTYEIPSLVVRGGNICGVSAKKYDTIAELEKHITTCVKQEGYQVNVKFFEKKETYMERLKSIAQLEETDKDIQKDLAVLQVLHDISL